MNSKRQKTYIIAEIGVNHGGSLDLAKEMTLAAKEAGADAVKFQTFTAKDLVGRNVPKVKYQRLHTSEEESHYQMIESLELSREKHFKLFDYCNEIGIHFISTPYDPESARFLVEELGCRRIKVASADLIDTFLHEYLSSTDAQVIVSTGMATMDEIAQTLDIYKNSKAQLSLLHCTSNYPCSLESINLKVMKTLEDEFKLPVGYSDHSVGPLAAVMSVALGAGIIEKHFTLDKNLLGPDHKASCTPAELKELVDQVRAAELVLGSPVKEVQEEELEMRMVSRKSLTLKRNVEPGEIVRRDDFVAKRPGSGVLASELKNVLGKKYKEKLSVETMLTWEMLEG